MKMVYVMVGYLVFMGRLVQGAGLSHFISAGTERAPVDCEVINQAIESLPKGGRIELGAGVFVCRFPVVLKRSHIELKGQGTGQTILRLANHNPAPVLVVGVLETIEMEHPKYGKQYYPAQEISNIKVSDLTVDGNLQQQPAEAHLVECYDPKLKSSLSCDGDGGRYIRNNGITVRRARDIDIQNVESVDCISGGMTIEKLTRRLHVNGYFSKGNYFDGLAGYETTDSLFENLVLSQNRFSGVSIDFDFEGNFFRNALIFENRDYGIFSANVSRNQFENMVVVDNGNYGIYFDGRRILKQALDGTPYYELIPGTCEDQVVKNNLILSWQTPGMMINHVCRGLQYQKTEVYGLTGGHCLSAPFEGAQYPGGGAQWTKEGVSCHGSEVLKRDPLADFRQLRAFDSQKIQDILNRMGIESIFSSDKSSWANIPN